MTSAALPALLLIFGAVDAAGAEAFQPQLREIEAALPAYAEVEKTVIRVPSRAIELGSSDKTYRCWRLRLTGDHGKQALGVFERLRSVQSALRDQNADLGKDLLLYEGVVPADPNIEERLRRRHQSLQTLLGTYFKLIRLGKRNGLLKFSEREMFSGRSSISPVLKSDDYTMVYDEAGPDCRRGPDGR